MFNSNRRPTIAKCPTPTDDALPGGGYHAFISYAHEDARVARRLHRSIETFRLPAGLRLGANVRVGDGAHPFYPCFLDNEELQGGKLSDQIVAALRQSRNLIVLCSIHSKKRDWVDLEVASFLSLNQVNRVFPVLTGETGGLQPIDLFPNSLREALNATQGEIGALNLLATDFRTTGDGARRGLLRIISGTSGVLFRDLIARYRNRQRNQRFIWASVLLVALLLTVHFTAKNLESTGWIETQSRVSIAQAQMQLGDGNADVIRMGTIEELKLALLRNGVRVDCNVGIGACGYEDEELGSMGIIFATQGPDGVPHDRKVEEAATLVIEKVRKEMSEGQKLEELTKGTPSLLSKNQLPSVNTRSLAEFIVTKENERFYFHTTSLPFHDVNIRHSWVMVWLGGIPDLVRAEMIRFWGRVIPILMFFFFVATEVLSSGFLLRRESRERR